MDTAGSALATDWHSASDAEVSARLQQLLEQARDTDDLCERLGCQDTTGARAAFLAATKTYHPNRFARRPEEVRRLASEYFLLLKETYDELKVYEQDQKLTSLREAARRKPSVRPRTSSDGDSPERDGLRKRRQEELRKRLQARAPTTEPKRRTTAQIRAAQPAAEDSRGDHEQRFDEAVRLLQGGELERASEIFRELATARTQEKRFRLYMHYSQGRIQQRDGNHDEARAEYKRALGLDASFAPALQSMSSLPETGRRKAGLFSKLFGK
jgi:tetratricopeptide (TPR) repeat protein